jgi:hypothetical protein
MGYPVTDTSSRLPRTYAEADISTGSRVASGIGVTLSPGHSVTERGRELYLHEIQPEDVILLFLRLIRVLEGHRLFVLVLIG